MGPQNLNVSRDVTTTLSETVCRPSTGTSYRQPVHQIWSLRLFSTKIWKTTKNAKIEVVYGLRVTQGHRKHRHLIVHIWLPIWL